jgi:hypothetical protein
MRIQDTDVWNDPLVQETLACVGELGELGDSGDINDNPVMKMLVETECFDPLAVSAVMAGECGSLFMKGVLPAAVSRQIEMTMPERVREQGPAHIFAAKDASALRQVLAEFSSEVTGEAYQKLLNRPDFKDIKPHIDAAAENVAALADGMIGTGLWRDVSPKLLDRFIESMENVSQLVESPVLKRGVRATVTSFKEAIATGTAKDIIAGQPQLDPACPYETLKQVAKTKFKVR